MPAVAPALQALGCDRTQAMELRLLLQPFSDEGRIGDALADRAKDATSVWILAAWAQESGLKHLQSTIAKVRRRRGGQAHAILGVDQGIATVEGLRRAQNTFNTVHLFHDGARTFHPKLYVIENDSQARVIVGSGNLTEGGLYNNFEAAAAVDLDRTDPLDEALRNEVRCYFESFISDGMPFRMLDSLLLRELHTSEAVVSSSKLRQRQRERQRREQPILRRLFGGPVRGLPSAPPITGRSRRRRPTSGAGVGTGSRSGTSVAAGGVAASWWKKLTMSDAMRKPDDSHQRRSVILGKAGHPIDQKVFFRDHFFANVAWTQETMRTGRSKELAVIPFDVHVERRHLGVFNLSVDHAPSRIASQNNAPTWLNWSSLSEQIRSRDYTNWYVLLERHSNGGFRLTLTRRMPGTVVVPPAARVGG